ncbi:hypothetical protein MBLNU230_g4237t1 [Neophaeotheca triangularis]
MSLQIFVAHTGQRLALDSSQVNTPESLRSWIADSASIPARNQIVLTAKGKLVRAQTLLTETELFVFERSLFSGESPTASAATSTTSGEHSTHYQPGPPPDRVGDQGDLQTWQSLFKSRRSWAITLLDGCTGIARQAERHQDEQAVIERSVSVAVASLRQHLKTAEQKQATIEDGSDELLRGQEALLDSWEANLDSLSRVPARSEFARFVQPEDSRPKARRTSSAGVQATLQNFVDVSAIRKAAGSAESIIAGFSDQITGLRTTINDVKKDSDELVQAVDQLVTASQASNRSEPAQLLEEIEMVVKKMTSDLEHLQSLPKTSQSVAQASKMASLHGRNYLPNLEEYCQEMNELVQRTKEQRDNAQETAMRHMRTLSAIESQLADVFSQTKGLEQPSEDHEAFAPLSVVARLPSVYGQLLVESVRRREWVAKMKRDAATLQEEMATYQEEEEKRRKRWLRSVEDVVQPEALQARALGIEFNLQNEGGSWPVVSRQELDAYLKTLYDIYGESPLTEEMDLSIRDLDKPTRKQIKHAKAFKNGSMHEAAFGDTSLMLRGDDQHKGLKESNSRLEEDLKVQKSRVRRLEDLLYRQNTATRASTDLFTPQSTTIGPPGIPSPQPSEDAVRTSSPRHRRLSSTAQAMEEKKLARRVVDLEAELQASKEKVAALEQEANVRRDSDAEAQQRVEEAVSIKKDLMENMEAQQREFADERRTLEQDLRDSKEKIEELEGAIEGMEDERTVADARILSLEEEILHLRHDSSGHAARAANEQDAKVVMEKKLQAALEAQKAAELEVKNLKAAQKEREGVEAEQLERLTEAHAHLVPDAEAPRGLTTLSATLEEVARKSAAHARDLAEAVAFAKSENESLRSNNEQQRSQLTEANGQLGEISQQSSKLEEQAAAEAAKSFSLEQQLRDEQEQLRLLRNKFAEGETGSEVLRQRVADAEAQAGKLSSELAEANSHINHLDIELMRLHKKHQTYHSTAEGLAERLEKRAERAKDISQRLFTYNARLSRLLERLGLAISYQDDKMVVERASKLGASTNISDPPAAMSRTTTLTSPPPTRKSSGAEEPAALSMVHWPDAQSIDEETAQFESYLQHISQFNVDTFSEAVAKRLRDFEYTAKKYNREAKESTKRAEGYKERSVRLKNEAYAKVAVKDFKEGDLALFLPTRGQAKGAWAAFNIGCPHFFLAEREGMRLGSRDFIVARITKVEQRIVDLSKSMSMQVAENRSVDEGSEAPSYDDDNPFELSDGLTWWMVHATEERGPGAAPTTPGLGKSTVAAANVDARGSIRIKRTSKGDDASKHLNKSLDSRRSSSNSKRSVAGVAVPTIANTNGSPIATQAETSSRAEAETVKQRPVAPADLGIEGSTQPSKRPPQPSSQQPQSEVPSSQVRDIDLLTTTRSASRQRSKSPSKSIRSLQKHLDTQSPVRSPAKSPSKAADKGKQPAMWESLWQAEFSIESPGKGTDK